MSAKSKKGPLAPRLRFPEFRDVGEWEIKKLSELIKMIIPPKKLLTSEYQKSGLFPIVDQSQKYIAGWTNDKFSIIDNHQSVIIFGDHTCILKLIEPPFAQGADGIKIFYCPSDILTKYAYQYILFNPIKMEEYKRHFSILKEKSITYPNDKIEQQRIADCLSSLDERIAAETNKLDTLKEHKKGLLKQLFPTEGETTPELRFPEFQDAGEWEDKILGNICEKIMDGTHFSPKSKCGPFLYITSKNIQNGLLDLSNASSISEEEHRQIFSKCPVKINDILLTKDGANTGNCALNNLDFEFSLLSSVAVLRCKKEYAIQEFIYYTIASPLFQKKIKESISGQAITRITLEKIGSYRFFSPKKFEQQRIADCLSSLDALITAQTQKINLLKDHKKGLMQQLFPRIDEV